MKQPLTAEEFYKIQFLKANSKLAAEKISRMEQNGRLIGAVMFMADLAKEATKERVEEFGVTAQRINRETQNFIMECGVTRHAPGGIADWSVEIGDSPETSFFNAEDIS